MKKIGLILILLLLMPIIFAETEVKIITKPFKEVSLKYLYDSGDNKGKLIHPDKASLTKVSDKDGIAVFPYTLSQTKFSIALRVIPDMPYYSYYNSLPINKQITLDLTKENPKPVITDFPKTPINLIPNETKSNTTSVQNNSNKPVENEPVSPVINQPTGNVISEGNLLSKWTKYLIIAIPLSLIAAIIFFLIIRKPTNFEPKIVKLSEKENFKMQRQLYSAQKKLTDAESEIRSIRERQNQINEVEKRLQNDKKELDRLRRGF